MGPVYRYKEIFTIGGPRPEPSSHHWGPAVSRLVSESKGLTYHLSLDHSYFNADCEASLPILETVLETCVGGTVASCDQPDFFPSRSADFSSRDRWLCHEVSPVHAG